MRIVFFASVLMSIGQEQCMSKGWCCFDTSTRHHWQTHPLAHSWLYTTTFFVTGRMQPTMCVTRWTRFFMGQEKSHFTLWCRSVLAPRVTRSHGSDTCAESHSGRVRAAGGATAAVDGGDCSSNFRCSSCNISMRCFSSRLNSHKVHSKPLGSRGSHSKQQLNMRGFDNIETLPGG